MSQASNIQWTDPTWNPWHGCKKESPGCKFCYMYRAKETRFGQNPTIVQRSKTKFNKPLKWTPEAVKSWDLVSPENGPLVFTCSWSDFFIEEADGWRPEAWQIIKDTPHLTYQILTKRPERIETALPPDWGNGYPNVWLGTSIESNEYKHRLVILNSLKTDSSVFKTFVSAEPLLEYLDLAGDDVVTSYQFEHLDWLIIGGESGNETGKYLYRECWLDWINGLIIQADEYKIPVFVKQLGSFISKELGLKDRHGGDMQEWPELLQRREFPEMKSQIEKTDHY